MKLLKIEARKEKKKHLVVHEIFAKLYFSGANLAKIFHALSIYA